MVQQSSQSPAGMSSSEKIEGSYSNSPTQEITEASIRSGEENIADAKDTTGSSFRFFLRVFSYNDDLGWSLNAVAAVSMIVSGALLPLMNIVFGKFINSFNEFAAGRLSPQDYRDHVASYALYFVYLFVGKFVLIYAWTVLISFTAIRAVKQLRVDFIRQTLRQEVSYFDESSSSISSQITTNGNLIYGGISEKLGLTIQAISTFITAFVVAFVMQWKLTLIVCCIVPVNIAMTVIGVTVDTALELKMYKHYGDADALVEEAFSTIRTAHAFWAFPKLSRRFKNILGEAKKIGDKKTLLYAVVFPAEFFCIFAGYGLAFWQGIRLYSSGEIAQPGTVVTVILAILVAAQALTQIAPQTIAIAKASAAAQELFSVIDRKSSIDSFSEEGTTFEHCQGHVQVRDLSFAYPSRPDVPVLENLSLVFAAGKTTAIVGASGSGKSTIIALMERWYSSNAGTIQIDGHDIESLKLSWLRTSVRLVQQEPTLFSGSIYQNVADGLTGTTSSELSELEKRELVEEACKSTYADGFIRALPKGYDTVLGERGGSLSGGQKQRLVIARSIISDPKILLLDEATSALDPHAEKIVQKALRNVAKSRTMVVIAHRLSTIRDADKIIVMSKGKVIEEGTHDELLYKENGSYAKLVVSQDLGGGHGNAMGGKETVPDEVDEIPDAGTPLAGDAASAHDNDVVESSEKGTSYGLFRGMFIVLRESKSLRLPVIATVLCAIAAGATYPALAILFSKTMVAFQDADVGKGDFFAVMFFVVALGNLIAYAVAGWAANVMSQYIVKEYRSEVFDNILRQDMTFFDLPDNSTGSLVSRVSSEPANLQELISFNLLLLLINFVSLVSSSVLAIAYGWKLGLVLVLGGLPLLVGSGYVRIRLEYKLDEDAAERFARSSGYATEATMAIRTVSSLALEPTVVERYHQSLESLANRAILGLGWKMLFYSLSQSISFLVMGLGFWYGGRLVSTGEYSTEQFYSVFVSVIFSGEAAAMLFQYTTSITGARSAMNYMFTLRNNRVFFDGGSEGSQAHSTASEISQDKMNEKSKELIFDKVGFAYSQRSDAKVLSDIDATIQADKTTAFVGASGCGKSTMIALMERFYDPTSGEIRTDGVKLQEYDCRVYRHDVALVQQEPVLYQGSIRDNISLGIEDYEPDENSVVMACKEANIWEFVSSLPEGLDTNCGSQGLSLSGGQRQRIAIARALIRSPRLLLLDEATSALDTESERAVLDALDRATSGRTTVAVAHRLSTIRNADLIIVFDKGTIVERGTHDELLVKGAFYYDMVMGQSLDREAGAE